MNIFIGLHSVQETPDLYEKWSFSTGIYNRFMAIPYGCSDGGGKVLSIHLDNGGWLFQEEVFSLSHFWLEADTNLDKMLHLCHP